MVMKTIEYDGQNVIYMICSSCNVNCKHCYVSYKGDVETLKAKADLLKLKKKYIIKLNGAEPLVNLEYLSLYPIIGQHHILTNGIAIYNNKDIFKLFQQYDISSISLSYHFDLQKKVSPIPISKLDDVIRQCKKHEIEVRLLTTISSCNFKNIEDYVDKAYKMGVRGIKFTNYIYQGNAINLESDLVLTQKQIHQVLLQINESRNNYNIRDLIIERCGSFGKSTMNSKFKCPAIEDSVVLTPDNKVYPCFFLAKPGNEIGIFRDGRILLYDIKPEDGCLALKRCNHVRGNI